MPTYKLIELIDHVISGEWGQDVEDETEGIKVIRTTNFSNTGKLDLDKEVVFRNIDKAKVEKKKLQLGDIIIEKSGGSPDQPVGRVVYFEEKELYLCNNFTSILRPKKELVVPKYLMYVLFNLHRKRRVLKFQNKTTGIINLKLDQYLNQTDVIIPSIEIQQKIVKALDGAYELIEKRQSQITALDELTQSLFLEMFGDPYLNSKKWPVVKVSEVTSSIVPGRDKPKSFSGDTPWITISDLNEMDYTYESRAKLGLTATEISEVRAKVIPRNSVIMSCVGELGIASINGCEVIINQQLHAYQCGTKINNFFLMTMIPYMKNYFLKVASSTTVLYMNKEKCNSMPIILPPIELQKSFEEKMKLINKTKQLYQKGLEEVGNLYNSLLQKAFKGELFQE